MDFVIFGDYKGPPQYMGSKSLCGLGSSLGVDRFLGKPKFWCGFSFRLLSFVFNLGWMIYGFRNLRGFHNSATVHGFLVLWPFRCFLSDD